MAAAVRIENVARGSDGPGPTEWRPGMRAMLALAAGLLAFAAVSAAGLLTGHVAVEQLRDDAGAELAQAARHIAETLDRGMLERWRDIQVASLHPVLRDPQAQVAAKREVLRALADTYPDYALLFLLTPDGRIEVTSRGVLEGVDVSRRDYYVHGREAPYAGDVHEAVLLAGKLPDLPNGEPPRFIDLAAPVTGPDGRFAGVLVAHLFWHWAERVQRDVLEPLQARRPGAEALVLSRDGTVLLGPTLLRGRRMQGFGRGSDSALRPATTALVPWPPSPDAPQTEALVASAPTQGHGAYPGLGWTVLVRQDSEVAFSAATRTQHLILLWAGLIAVAAALLCAVLAHMAARPIRALTAVVARLTGDPHATLAAEAAAAGLARTSSYREGAALSRAVAELIASQRRAGADLTASEMRFRALAEAVPSLLFEADAQGRTVYVNPRMTELTGLSVAELAGDGWLRCLHSEDRQSAADAWAAAVRSEEPYQIEYRFLDRDGQARWFLARGVPVRGPDSRVVRWVGTCTDIDDRRQAEAVLARDRTELARLVDQQTQDLHEVQARLVQSQRMEAVGQLTAGVAHDFNNILQAQLGALNLLERQVRDHPRALKLVRLALNAGDHGAKLTHNLLSFSRRQMLAPRPVLLGAVLDSLRQTLSRTLGSRVVLESTAHDATALAYVDPAQLEAALLNLALNARDAMPDGGRLTIEATAWPTGDAPEGAPLDAVLFAVSDTGHGMAPEVLARVYEPFFTTKGVGQGSGLGLSMVQGFVEQSGGAMRLFSAVGQGTRVEVWLPRATEIEPSPTPAAAISPRPPETRVLLVDDGPDVLAITAELLEGAGFEVVQATCGEEALRLLGTGRPFDVLVTDHAMPGMQGGELVRRVREVVPGLPALVVTGYAEAELLGKLPPNVHLVRKPLRSDALIRQISDALGRASVLASS